MFAIEDELHDERHGTYATRAQAEAELALLAALPWDEAPNRAPCTGWRTCGRRWELAEYDDSQGPWRELDRDLALEVSREGSTRPA